MPVLEKLEQDFADCRASLINYKNASLSERDGILKATKEFLISALPDNASNKDDAIEIYKKFSFAATLINYADALRRIENQEYFDILVDFSELCKISAVIGPVAEGKTGFEHLNDYFEFHSKAPQMKLKMPIAEIPAKIWDDFRSAQKIQLVRLGKTDKFNLDEIASRDPSEQLYPLPIQMMGRYENEAVDRICVNSFGKFRFANRFGSYLLPGGGMVDVDLARSQDTYLHKMLDEHLEEEHGNLVAKAARFYNELPRLNVQRILAHEVLGKIEDVSAVPAGLRSVRAASLAKFNSFLTQLKSNAEIISQMVLLVDSELSKAGITAGDIKFLNELRATIQLEPFKQTSIYNDAFLYIKQNTDKIDIEQFGDTRACGGKQISHSFLMRGEPLEKWFGDKFGAHDIKLADDLAGADIVHLSLLEVLAKFSSVKFSHNLIALALQVLTLENGTLTLDAVWKREEYDAARLSLIKGVSSLIDLYQQKYASAPRFFAAGSAASSSAASAIDDASKTVDTTKPNI